MQGNLQIRGNVMIVLYIMIAVLGVAAIILLKAFGALALNISILDGIILGGVATILTKIMMPLIHPVFCILIFLALLILTIVIERNIIGAIIFTLASAGLLGYIVFYEVHKSYDFIWSIFWTAVTVIIVVVLHIVDYSKHIDS